MRVIVLLQTFPSHTFVVATCIVIIVGRAIETTLTGPVVLVMMTVRTAVHGKRGTFWTGWTRGAIMAWQGVVFEGNRLEIDIGMDVCRRLKEKNHHPESKVALSKFYFEGKYLALAHPESAALLFVDYLADFAVPVVRVVVEGDCGTENVVPDFV